MSQYITSNLVHPGAAEAMYGQIPDTLPGLDLQQQILAIVTIQPVRQTYLRRRFGLSQRSLYNLLQPMRDARLIEGATYVEMQASSGRKDDLIRLGPAFAINDPACGEVLLEIVLEAIKTGHGHTRLELIRTTGLQAGNVTAALRRLTTLEVLKIKFIGALAIYKVTPVHTWNLDRAASTRERTILQAAAWRLEGDA